MRTLIALTFGLLLGAPALSNAAGHYIKPTTAHRDIVKQLKNVEGARGPITTQVKGRGYERTFDRPADAAQLMAPLLVGRF